MLSNLTMGRDRDRRLLSCTSDAVPPAKLVAAATAAAAAAASIGTVDHRHDVGIVQSSPQFLTTNPDRLGSYVNLGHSADGFHHGQLRRGGDHPLAAQCLDGVEDGCHGHRRRIERDEAVVGRGQLGLELAQLDHGLGDSVAVVSGTAGSRGGGELDEVPAKVQAGRAGQPPPQHLEELLLHPRHVGGRVGPPAQLGHELGVHLERLPDLDGRVERRHAQELVLPAVAEGRRLLVGEGRVALLLLLLPIALLVFLPSDAGQVPVDVREGDGHGLAGEFAVVGNLRAPLDHLGAAGGVGGC